MTRQEARKIVASFPKSDAQAAFASGLSLLKADYPELLMPLARKLSKAFAGDPRMHQLLGLAARAVGDSQTALEAFGKAARLAPTDGLIAHSYARASLDAGVPAVALFERAAQLAPQDGSIFQGLAAALFREGRSSEAIAFLDRVVGANPEWLDGQRDLAHLRGQMGLAPLETLAHKSREPGASEGLLRLHVNLALEARDLDLAASALHAARSSQGEKPWLQVLAGHIHSEQGDTAAADTAFGKVDALVDIADASLHARHLVKTERADAAASLIEPLIERDRDNMLWPYLSLAWRMTDDRRWQWLEGDPSLVGVYDLSQQFGDFDRLVSYLRELHVAKAAPLDQSVRDGTQTDGNLLLRTEPVIRELRRALLGAVAKHVRQLSPHRPRHPTLLQDHEPQRVSGSWSVRLTDAGFHVDHVHSQGWLSSAFYVGLPAASSDGDPHAGWLSLGQSRELVPSLPPHRLIEPKIGRLVLFPSTMWHGTRPFPQGERMTVAFDVARPKQSNFG
ncbi:putative 2OG-Fe(II) oxygenase [Qipengyuania qiaonensis]|uniref:Tetratricopeptide repeat protein n=1 Tax=Qipengyuania qiaonensis TaxID=2867240 RepID=A0ABS7J7E3_9SPHN|nr:putative 2OG-Fe(II) oxygenase [Qipengyuania qiaonensis]MBX7483230.1 tetratricopeptide repeat protein [Qipengyuania qiaonensis]